MTPSTKKTSGKKKENSTSSDRRERKDEEEKKLAREFMATSLGRTLDLTDERLAAAGGNRAPTSPDNPPCDGCKQPFTGTNQCGRCESVFYCGRECQVSHWNDQHKNECKQLKKQNDATAQRVLQDFENVQRWTLLDIAGAYKAAVKQGLHDKIREVLESDKAEIVERYRGDRRMCVCYAQWVMSVLFRGQRAEGKADEYNPAFNCVDGLRIKGYVKSHPDALDAWLQASVQLIRAVLDRPMMLRTPLLHRSLHDAARDVWSGWSLVLTSSTASRAIFAPFPPASAAKDGDGEDGESAESQRQRVEDHAREIVKTMGEAIRLVKNASDPNLDPNSKVEGNVYIVAAMVLVRVQEYGIGVDVEAMLKLKGTQKKMFQHVALPMAKRTIEKGRMLNVQETNAALAASSRGLGLR